MTDNVCGFTIYIHFNYSRLLGEMNIIIGKHFCFVDFK